MSEGFFSSSSHQFYNLVRLGNQESIRKHRSNISEKINLVSLLVGWEFDDGRACNWPSDLWQLSSVAAQTAFSTALLSCRLWCLLFSKARALLFIIASVSTFLWILAFVINLSSLRWATFFLHFLFQWFVSIFGQTKNNSIIKTNQIPKHNNKTATKNTLQICNLEKENICLFEISQWHKIEIKKGRMRLVNGRNFFWQRSRADLVIKTGSFEMWKTTEERWWGGFLGARDEREKERDTRVKIEKR